MQRRESAYYITQKRFRPRETTCEQCGARFMMRGGHHRFCSEECILKHRNGVRVCPICGKEFAPKKPGIQFCSRECYLTSVRRENSSPDMRN